MRSVTCCSIYTELLNSAGTYELLVLLGHVDFRNLPFNFTLKLILFILLLANAIFFFLERELLSGGVFLKLLLLGLRLHELVLCIGQSFFQLLDFDSRHVLDNAVVALRHRVLELIVSMLVNDSHGWRGLGISGVWWREVGGHLFEI